MTDIDNLGFVTMDDIQNTFAMNLETIEADIDRNGVPLDAKHAKRVVMDWLDDLRLSLMKRSRGNLERYLKHNPEIKKEIHQEQTKQDQTSQIKSWEDRVKNNRQVAIQDCYKT